jgi:hypothetical protein
VGRDLLGGFVGGIVGSLLRDAPAVPFLVGRELYQLPDTLSSILFNSLLKQAFSAKF